VRGSAGRLARVPVDDDRARHQVLGDARAGVAVDAHGRELVHAGAVVADVPLDLDLHVRVDAAGDGVRAVRVDDPPMPRSWALAGELVEAAVELRQRRDREVDDLDVGRRRGSDGLHTFARSQA
jgi:hypothetical protein